MADAFTRLGSALGGDSESAYQEGRFMGAKTEDALASARARVDENAAKAQVESDLIASGMDRTRARAAATALRAGANLGDPIQAMLKGQEFDFRAQAGDPNVPLDVGQRALLGVANAPVEPIYKVGNRAFSKFDTPEDLDDLGMVLGGDTEGSSSFIQSARAFGLLQPDGSILPSDRALAYEILRNTDKAFDVGGVPQIRSGNPYGIPGTGGASTVPAGGPALAPRIPLADVNEVATNKGEIAAATERGQARGRNAAGLESTMTTIDKFEGDIARFLSQPGFDALYGNLQGTEVGKAVGGVLDQDIANARADIDSLGGEAFLASIQKMRGFGQLSNQEGAKVQTALTRALDTRIGSAEARKAWGEVAAHMKELKRVAAVEAGQAPGGAAAPTTPATNTPTETKVVGGKTYQKINGQWFEDDGT